MESLNTTALEAMSKSDLVTYANMTYGCNVNSQLDRHSLIQTIITASQKFSGNVDVIIDDTNVLKPGFARIKINKTEMNKQGRPAIVSVNGKAASLPIGTEIVVPLKYVEVLNNAVQYRYEPDPANDNELARQEVHSYPFTVMEMSPELPEG